MAGANPATKRPARGTQQEPSVGTQPDNSAATKRADRERQRAYDEGQRDGQRSKVRHRKLDHSGQPTAELDSIHRDGYKAGRKQQFTQRRNDVGGSVHSFASDSSGLVLGIFAYTLFMNFMRGGTPQVRSWLAAKFINRTSASATQIAPLTPSQPTPPDVGPKYPDNSTPKATPKATTPRPNSGVY